MSEEIIFFPLKAVFLIVCALTQIRRSIVRQKKKKKKNGLKTRREAPSNETALKRYVRTWPRSGRGHDGFKWAISAVATYLRRKNGLW